METELSVKNNQGIAQGISDITREALGLTIIDNVTYEKAGELLKAHKAMEKEIKDYHKPIKQAIDVSKKKVIDAEKAELEKLNLGTLHLNHEMTAWYQAAEKKRKEEEARLAEIARKEAEEQQLRDAEQAEKEGNKEEAEAILSEEVHIPPPVVQKTTPKVSGVAMRTTWKAKVSDLKALIKAVHDGKVPINAIQANEVFLNQQARALKGTMEYPGVKFYPESKMGGVRE